MASHPSAKKKLRLNVPVVRRESDPAFYIVPPVLLAVVFAFCAYVPREVKKADKAVAAAPVAATPPAEPEKKELQLVDPNENLPEFSLPSGMQNVLVGAADVRVSAPGQDAPASNAVDGSCENDRHVAVALPNGGEHAWWQVEAPGGQPFNAERFVVYGGGSKSPVGKFKGGFSVELQFEDGQTEKREFCKAGFALEGYETWQLSGKPAVQRVRVTALKPDAPVVLREVQLLGPAGAK